MKKNRILPSALNGTPLTDEELKNIIGGTRTTRCTCDLTLGTGSGSGSQTSGSLIVVAAENESICSIKCASKCDNNPLCLDYSYSFLVTGN